MKFLVTLRRRDGVPVPPDAVAAMLRAQIDWLEEKLSEGTFDVAYGFAQGAGGISIVNADTAEQLNDVLSEAPLFPITHIEVVPLADVRTALGNGAKAMQRTAAIPA